MRAAVVGVGRRVGALPSLIQDGLLYLASAAYALVMISFAASADYRAWGEIALVAYLIAGVASLAVASYAPFREHPVVVRRVRRTLGAGLVIGVLFIPLAAELHWRAEASPGAHAQPEVAVVERAGDRVANSRSAYLADPTSVGISPSNDAHATDASTYFPYFPGMIPFGLTNVLAIPVVLTDARVAFVSFSLLVAAVGLALAGGGRSRRSRVAQFLVILPTGALPMVTGGDDLPVLALLFLGFVLGARRHPGWAGLVLGLAGTLKLTAWPAIAVAALLARDRQGRAATGRYTAAAAAVLVPALAYGFFSAPGAFVNNALRFPLGLADLHSPAASPLLGHLLVSRFPAERHLLTALIAVVGLAVIAVYLARRPPRTMAGAAEATGTVLLVATLLAPATRFGYLIYPANLFVWSCFLAPIETSAPVEVHAASPRSRRRSSTELDALGGLPPPSAEERAPLEGVMRTPASQS
jgi:Glycosyltransferase family 87